MNGTPIKNKNYQVINNSIYINEEVFEKGLQEYYSDVAALLVGSAHVMLARLIKENIKFQLNIMQVKENFIISAAGMPSQYRSRGGAGLRSAIKNNLIVTPFKDGKITIDVKDDGHDTPQLALALNYGTGMFNELGEKKRIYAKNGGFMFIPGLRYTSIFGSRKIGIGRQKMSLSGLPKTQKYFGDKATPSRIRSTITTYLKAKKETSKKVRGIYGI
jgi:hypothetical protein